MVSKDFEYDYSSIKERNSKQQGKKGLISILKNKIEDNIIKQIEQNENDLADELDMGNLSVFNPRPKSCREYAYEEEKNKKYRISMEDMHLIIDKFNKDQSKGYFSLFDGHGGTEIVEYIRDKLPIALSTYMKDTNDVARSLIKAFEKINSELKIFKNIDSSGSTGTVCVILKETDVLLGMRKVLYCANVGDTRCVLLNSSGCKRLSYDHKCSDEAEAQRIKRAGGNVVQDRIFGKLALSRSFGDTTMKNFGVIATPSVNKIEINSTDKYFIICSDGVWDVVTEEDIFYFSFQCDNTKELAQSIIRKALENGSTDNISCIVVKL